MEAERLRALLRAQTIATMPELKAALGTDVDVTVFRKLRELAYHSSYSHRGKYYTLDAIARFDARGLWSCRSVWFSAHETLRRTCEVLVTDAEAGYATDELEQVLHVGVKDPLRTLAGEGRIVRERRAGRFMHFAADAALRKAQVLARHVWDTAPSDRSLAATVRVVPDELKAAILLFISLLDEQQRRLYAGLESLKLGHGGDRRVADRLALDPGTVAKGRQQLLAGDVPLDRVRQTGGGRTPLEKQRRT